MNQDPAAPQRSYAFRLDGAGGGTRIDLFERSDEGTLCWIHLAPGDEEGRRWLREDAHIPWSMSEAMRAEETRPRCVSTPEGLLVVLRGANLNTGADPVDMVSLRAWLEPRRIVTLTRRRVFALRNVAESLEVGQGPASVTDLLTTIVERLLDNVRPVLEDLEGKLDDLEGRSASAAPRALQPILAGVRQDVIALRRHLAPQREALTRLAAQPIEAQEVLREQAERQTRVVEDLDELRERATVLQDFLASRISDAINQKMLVLSLITAVFLPLSLLTGLLGVNVGGIPWAESPLGFWSVCLLLVSLALFQLWLLKRTRWL